METNSICNQTGKTVLALATMKNRILQKFVSIYAVFLLAKRICNDRHGVIAMNATDAR